MKDHPERSPSQPSAPAGDDVGHLAEHPAPDCPFARALADTPVVVFIQDRDLRYLWLFNSHHGAAPERVVGKTDADLFSQEEAARLTEIKRRVLETGVPARTEAAMSMSAGTCYCELSIQPLRDRQGKCCGVMGASVAVTERKRMEDELRESQERFRFLFTRAFDPIVVFNHEGKIMDANEAAFTVLGYPRRELMEMSLPHIHPAADVARLRSAITTVLTNGGRYLVETTLQPRTGEGISVEAGGTAVTIGGERHVLCSFRDITDRKRAEEALQAMTLVDDLTGLYNRRGFMAIAGQQLKILQRGRRMAALIYADLDNMKLINDTHGHPTGDRALVAVARVLKRSLRDSDIIARLAGDEFAALAVEVNLPESLRLVERIEQNLEAENAQPDVRVRLSLSIGDSSYDPAAPCTLGELIEQADKRMYEAKRKKHQSGG